MSRAAVLQFFHEANAFSPVRVRRADFLARHFLRGDAVRDAFGATGNWLGGVLTALKDAGVETHIGLCTAALPSGPVVADDFRHMLGEIIASLDPALAAGPLDHVFLLLHGALVVEDTPAPEAMLLRAVRERVGPTTFIAVALDFHANVNDGLVGAADLVIGGKLYPHTDTHERGARLVELALSGNGRRTFHARLGKPAPMPFQVTCAEPFEGLLRRTCELERDPALDDVTLLGGFPYARAADAAASVLVTGEPAATRRAVEAMRRAWDEVAGQMSQPIPSITDALPAIEASLRRGRVVLVDVGDNPGGGGRGDRVEFLPALLRLGRPFAFGALVNPELVGIASHVGVGNTFDANLGTIGDQIMKVPARVLKTGPVRYRNAGAMMRGEELNGGEGAVLAINESAGVIVATSLPIQAYDAAFFSSQGIDPETMDILAIKSTGHFRASFTALATGAIVLADSGGLSSPLLPLARWGDNH